MPLAFVTCPWTPPSLNRQGRVHPMQQARLKRQLEDDLFVLLLEAKIPKGLERVQVSATLRFPVRRTRDEGNFRWMLEKALGDVLQQGGWLANDSPEHYSFGALAFDPELGQRRCRLSLTYDIAG